MIKVLLVSMDVQITKTRFFRSTMYLLSNHGVLIVSYMSSKQGSVALVVRRWSRYCSKIHLSVEKQIIYVIGNSKCLLKKEGNDVHTVFLYFSVICVKDIFICLSCVF